MFRIRFSTSMKKYTFEGRIYAPCGLAVFLMYIIQKRLTEVNLFLLIYFWFF
ncbi:hypothetical protein [Salmonella phage PHA46]